jgi:uncharacterized protein YjbI with pentapeptide repeats
VRDVLLGAVLTLALFGTQFYLDERRSDREADAAQRLSDEADRREDVRFVRDRSSQAHLDRPFARIDLIDENVSGLELAGADFGGASLVSTDFEDSDLSGADFSGAMLFNANLNYADLSRADFSCRGVHRYESCSTTLGRATLFGTNLSHADLTGADLTGAWLTEESDLTGTVLRRANLSQAQLFDVDLSTADLTGADLDGVCYDQATKWPKTFVPPPPAKAETCH